MRPDASFWHGKRVLLTGHTGFKGAWLALWLHRLGAQVSGLALPAAGQPNLFDLAGVAECVDSRYLDIRDAPAVAALVRSLRPDVVLHLAAQALVRSGYRSPLETFDSNIMGTAHVLDALRDCTARVAVVVTTDKVYRNRETRKPYAEDDRLGGHDPYSASKAAAELVVESYRDAYLANAGVAVASARAGNVIGGGDWAQDRLLPDAMRAWQLGQTLELRRPDAVRPWQHVLEPLAGYLRLAQCLWQQPALAGAYNLGPDADQNTSVGELVLLAREALGHGATCFARVPDGPHEAGLLVLDNRRARERLGLQPVWTVAQAVTRSVAWYRRQQQGEPARDLCMGDIDDFETNAQGRADADVAHCESAA